MSRTELAGQGHCGHVDRAFGPLRRDRRGTKSYWSRFPYGYRGRYPASQAIREGLAAVLIQISWRGYQYCARTKGDRTIFLEKGSNVGDRPETP